MVTPDKIRETLAALWSAKAEKPMENAMFHVSTIYAREKTIRLLYEQTGEPIHKIRQLVSSIMTEDRSSI